MLDAVDGKLDHPIVIERDDGFVDAHSAAVYLTPFNEWQPGLRKAMRHVRGKILDIGAGAGRISLYLQDRGFDVTAMDNSPQAIEACRRRGVRQTAVTDVAHVAELGEFDTILLLGGNLSLLGSPSRARRLLRVFLKASTPRGRIIAQGLDPYVSADPVHRDYHAENRKAGRLGGQVRVRIRYRTARSNWLRLMWLSREELEHILNGTSWNVSRYIDDGGMYVAIIDRKDSNP